MELITTKILAKKKKRGKNCLKGQIFTQIPMEESFCSKMYIFFCKRGPNWDVYYSTEDLSILNYPMYQALGYTLGGWLYLHLDAVHILETVCNGQAINTI